MEGGPVSLDPLDKNRAEIAKQSKEIENLTKENDLIKQKISIFNEIVSII